MFRSEDFDGRFVWATVESFQPWWGRWQVFTSERTSSKERFWRAAGEVDVFVWLCVFSSFGWRTWGKPWARASWPRKLPRGPWMGLWWSMFIPSFKKPSCITKKPKNLVDVDYNLPENVSCKPSEAKARGCWMIEIIESKEQMFVDITMQICKTMTAVW